MSSVNKVILIGNATKDVELKKLESGKAVAAFSIATNRVWKNSAGEKQEAVEFHNIVLWEKLAEIAAQYLKKGNKVYIEGRLQTREWEAQDGTKRRATEIVGENMTLLTPKGSAPSAPQTQTHADMGGITTTMPEAPVPEPINLEDIPF